MSARASASATIAAPPAVVYRVLADYREHHPRILPRPPFTGVEVLEGGVGAGTRVRVGMRVGGRERAFVMLVHEPEPGRVLEEVDEEGARTRFTLTPEGGGTRVEIETVLAPKKGLAGLVERLVNPPYLRSVYRKELAQLDEHARSLAASGP